MSLLDTLDAALMFTLYTSSPSSSTTTNNKKDPISLLYYSIVLTSLTILVAAVIGCIQLLTLLLNVLTPTPTGEFWDGVAAVGDNYDIVGGVICGSFVVVGVGAVGGYKYWRRWVDLAGGDDREGRRVGVGCPEEGGGARDVGGRGGEEEVRASLMEEGMGEIRGREQGEEGEAGDRSQTRQGGGGKGEDVISKID